MLPLVEHYDLGGRRLNLLAGGRVVNLAAAQGHPPAVMDMSFANQALAAEHLVAHAGELEPGVQPVPREIDDEVARLKLESLGVEIDELTGEQAEYLRGWSGQATPADLDRVVQPLLALAAHPLVDRLGAVVVLRRLPAERGRARARGSARRTRDQRVRQAAAARARGRRTGRSSPRSVTRSGWTRSRRSWRSRSARPVRRRGAIS